jgi:cyclopropane fatty-acyl-phospholipid synthase-like methyltransferase
MCAIMPYFLGEFMERDKVKTLYGKKARFYQWFLIDILGWGKQLEAFFRNSNYLSPKLKILDAGCGTGIVTKILYSIAEQQGFRDIQFYAFDLTPAMLDVFSEWIAKQGIKNIELTQANVLLLEDQLLSHWREYDLIVSATMLEYIQKPKVTKAVSNLKNLLKSKGVLLLFVTRRNFRTRWLGQAWWKANVYEEREIEQILHQAGFSTVRFKTFTPSWQNSIMVVEARK